MLAAIKVLAPGYDSSQDIRTLVTMAVAVLAFTQRLNVARLQLMAHAVLRRTSRSASVTMYRCMC